MADRPAGSSHFALTMAVLSGIGGVAGYLKTGSMPSLVAGVGIGGLYAFGGWQINRGSADLGHRINTAAALLLAGAMGPRYLTTRKLWPAGIMAVAGLASAVYEGRQAWLWMQ